MAYKFQIGDAIVSGSLTRDAGDVQVRNHAGVQKAKITRVGIISGSGEGAFGSIDTDGEVDAGSYEIGGVSVINASKQLGNIATLDATTEATIENAIDALPNLTTAGTNGAELNFLGSIDSAQGLLVNNVSTITAGRAIQNVAAYSGSGNITGPSFAADGNAILGGNLVAVQVSGSGASSLLSLAVNGAASIASTGIGTLSSLTIGGQSVIDSNRNAIKFGNVSGSGTAEFLGVLKAGNSGFQVAGDGATQVKSLDVNSGGITEAGAIAGATTIDASGDLTVGSITNAEFEASSAGAVSGSATLKMGGAVQLDGVAAAGLAVGADSFYFLDDTDKLMKKQEVGSVVTALAGSGILQVADKFAVRLGANGGVGLGASDGLFVTASALAAAAVAVNADSLMIFNAVGVAKKESFADYATALAGAGLTATNGVLSTQGGTTSGSVDGKVLTEGYNYLTGTAGGAFKLPIDASFGDVIHVKNSTAGTALIVRQSNHNIDGADQVLLESAQGAVSMVYALTSSWKLV